MFSIDVCVIFSLISFKMFVPVVNLHDWACMHQVLHKIINILRDSCDNWYKDHVHIHLRIVGYENTINMFHALNEGKHLPLKQHLICQQHVNVFMINELKVDIVAKSIVWDHISLIKKEK